MDSIDHGDNNPRQAMSTLPQRFLNLFTLRVELQRLPERLSGALVVLRTMRQYQCHQREVYTSGEDEFDCEGRIDTSSCTFMKLRAAPSRYQALDQRGRSILHLSASSRARSPCLIRSQQRLWLAYMAASDGSVSSTCVYNEQVCAQFSSTGW